MSRMFTIHELRISFFFNVELADTKLRLIGNLK